MYAHETWTHVNKNNDAVEVYRIGDSGFYEPYTDNIRQLFVSYQRHFGRCISKIYIDLPDNKVKPVGWVFEKKQKYDDCNKYFTMRTWVTLHESEPSHITTYHYKFLQ